jgi:phosphoribosyl 1,2-cyclic phosphodiesterase
MRVTFWGVRGSIPCPGPTTVRYGGNTSCLELYLEEIDRLIIIDAGSGIRELGNHLLERYAGNGIRSDIFLTHTHWDHIMGFPFFAPIYLPSSQFSIHGPVTFEEESLKQVLSGQWTYHYFPVRQHDLSSKINYVHLKESEYDLGQGLHLRTKFLNHPLLCLGYRFEFRGKVFCTAYDTEPYVNVFARDPTHPDYDPMMVAQGDQVVAEESTRLEQFVSGADLLVYDAQYTEKEYHAARRGWGHSTMEHAIDVARRNQIKQLALFHHDIQRTDDELDALSLRYCTGNGDTKIFFAKEGTTLYL